jgi:hypothetical protein
MPILYVHGVNTRTREPFENGIRRYLRRYVAPAISDDPATVMIEQAFWGDVAVKFAFDGVSRPRSQLLGQGADEIADISGLHKVLAAATLNEYVAEWPSAAPSPSDALIGGSAPASDPTASPISLDSFSEDELSDLLAGIIGAVVPNETERCRLTIAADEVSRDARIRAKLSQEQSAEVQVAILLDAIQARSTEGQVLLAQGFADWVGRVRDRVGEAVRRSVSFPVYAASVVAAELRKPLHELVSLFIGDAFHYLHTRLDGTGPGVIPRRVLDQLMLARSNQRERNGEKIVVLSHSMGGQIVYDAVSHFLPSNEAYADIRVDFWCATASQVGFFEEAKLFLASDPQYGAASLVPLPHKNLGAWWNAWDPNDILSFKASGVFQEVDDEPYSSGMSLLSAHGGYLERPSFYRQWAEKLGRAAARGWRPS